MSFGVAWMIGKRKLDKAVTLIAGDTEIAGDLRFSDQLYLNGRIRGNLEADDAGDATVVISEEGSVTGDIRVPNVIISGRVEGDVYAAGRVELTAKARVKGNVYYKLMEMELGALVDGLLLHHESTTTAVSTHPGGRLLASDAETDELRRLSKAEPARIAGA